MPINRNQIFSAYFTGVKSGWSYKLEIIPADTTALSSPAEVVLPDNIVKIKELSYFDYGDYPLGLGEAPYMKLEFDLRAIPTTGADATKYEAFENAILNPAVETTDDLNFGSCIFSVNLHDYVLGTYYRLYCDSDGDGTYTQIWRGVQTESDAEIYTSERESVEVESVGLGYYIASLIHFDFSDIDDPTMIMRRQCYELSTSGHSAQKKNIFHLTAYTTDSRTEKSYLHFSKLDNLFDYIDAAADYFYEKITRTSLASGLDFYPGVHTKYYRQLTAGTGGLGSEIAAADQYVLALTSREDTPADANYEKSFGGFYYNDGAYGESISARYKNCWDFFADLFIESLTKVANFSGIIWQRKFIYHSSEPITLSADRLNNIKLYRTKGGLNTVTASCHEIYDEDIDKIDVTGKGLRNQDKILIPIIFNNLPTATDYEYETTEDGQKLYDNQDSRAEWEAAPKARVSNIYYYDSSYLTFSHPKLDGPAAMVRAHEFCRTRISAETEYTDDLDNCAFAAFDPTALVGSQSKELFISLGLETGKPRIQARAAYEMFKKCVILEFETDIYYTGSYPLTNIWRDYQAGEKFIFDPTELRPIFSGMATEWVLLSLSVNFETETVSAKLISKEF